MKLLGDRSPEEFLNEYWQKKPLFVRGAIPDFESPVSPQELAGLALDESVESRIVMEKGGAYPWELRRGPFSEDDFLGMPESHWTLLVQEVDQLLPEVAAIRNRFRFIPDWRIDDVMISYAAPEGGVGPHIDNYDVFLLQGMGERTWHISGERIEDEQIVEGLDVRMLADFAGDTTFTARPGDLLYLPPRFAHHGIAVDDCLTYSVGFRAPSQKELVSALLEEVVQQADPQTRYADPDLSPAEHPGEIGPDAIEHLQELVSDALNEVAFEDWFGRYTTAPPPGQVLHPPETTHTEQSLKEAISNGLSLERAPSVRMSYIVDDDGRASLFAAGAAYDTSLHAAQVLTSSEYIANQELRELANTDNSIELITQLVDRGVFHTS